MDYLFVRVRRALPAPDTVPANGAPEDPYEGNVADPEHPQYFVLQLALTAMANLTTVVESYQGEYAPILLKRACGALVGTYRGLLGYQSEGYAPTEFHDPREGVFAQLTPDGWAILYAPAAVCLYADAALSAGSVTVEFYEDWCSAMAEVVWVGGSRAAPKGVGRAGAGEYSAPLFWTSLAGHAREVV